MDADSLRRASRKQLRRRRRRSTTCRSTSRDGRDVRRDRARRRGQDDDDPAGRAGCCGPIAGAITVLGRDPVREHRAITQAIGYLSQRFSLYGDLTIDENIAFFAEIHGVPRYAAGARPPARDDAADAVPRAARRPPVGRHEAEAGAGLHARPRAAKSCCSTSRRPASIPCRGASSGSCCRSSCRAASRS